MVKTYLVLALGSLQIINSLSQAVLLFNVVAVGQPTGHWLYVYVGKQLPTATDSLVRNLTA